YHGGKVKLKFSVSDSGTGIAREKQAVIFDAFSQADESVTRRFGGTGLGLAICKALVEQMGGEIWFESALGVGTTFHFWIPVEVTTSPSETRTELWQNASNVVGKTILIIDENVANGNNLKRVLSEWKMQPVVASSWHEAVEIKEKSDDFDLILVNLGLSSDSIVPSVELAKSLHEDAPLLFLASRSSFGGNGNDLTHDPTPNLPKAEARCSILYKPATYSSLLDEILILLEKSHKSQRFGAETTPTLRKKATAQVSPNQCKILLAEDNQVNQKLARAILEKAGYNVDVVSNGRQVLCSLENSRYDLILMDIQMPEMDGYTATKLLRESGVQIPIVACTARLMKEERIRGAEVGMSAYLEKPVQVDQLISLCRRLTLGAGDDSATSNKLSSYSDFHGNAKLHPLLIQFARRVPAYEKEIRESSKVGSLAFIHSLDRCRGVLSSFGFYAVADRVAEIESLLEGNQSSESIEELVQRISLDLQAIYKTYAMDERGASNLTH
ncbi:MAG: response regulator, partial [Bdellovibrionales bacterium]|nr:response regulator [Bdellovibrionales bacterium]